MICRAREVASLPLRGTENEGDKALEVETYYLCIEVPVELLKQILTNVLLR
jgi:hypothetical protein